MKTGNNISVKIEYQSLVSLFQNFIQEVDKMLTVECNAKNEAYYFIISSGNFNNFMEFRKAHKNEDTHIGCSEELKI